MEKKELFKLPEGSIELTDNIYNYTLTTFKHKGQRIHRLQEKGMHSSAAFFFHEERIKDPDSGDVYKDVTISFGCAGLHARCGNYVYWLTDLTRI